MNLLTWSLLCQRNNTRLCLSRTLSGLISTGNQASARKLTRARILLKADEGEFGPTYADKQIQEAVEVSASTIERMI